MREILFRGKRIDDYVNDKSIDYAEKDTGEWVYGDIIHRHYYKNTDVIVIRTEDSGFDNYSDYEVDPETVGQFTGLTDKNGKKIFDGDIIKVPDCCHRGDAIGFVYYDCDETAYCAKCWGIKYQLGADLSSDSIEIIGNTYDNSELLELTESR